MARAVTTYRGQIGRDGSSGEPESVERAQRLTARTAEAHGTPPTL